MLSTQNVTIQHRVPSARLSSKGRNAATIALVVAALTGSATAWANSLDTALIRRVVASNRASIRTCYEATLKTQPDAAGKMVVKFSVAADGNVTAASATGLDESLCTCVADVFRAMKFPQGPGLIHISYPLTFAPNAAPGKK